MTNKRRILLILTVVILQLLSGMDHHHDLVAQQREKLLFKEIPIVITASRKEQLITEAATTITVINAKDIQSSGATTIPEILSMVAGIDIMNISPRDQQVGVRGLVSPMNNKLMVLVDGRSMYTDLYGAVFWELLPIGIQEINRIEIVKSPVSSIYGANAFCGAVNIITKTPDQLKGTHLYTAIGEHKTYFGTIMHAGSLLKNQLKYKISCQWDQTEEWEVTEKNTPRNLHFNALLQYLFKPNRNLTLSVGRGNSKNGRFLLSGWSASGTSRFQYQNDYIQLEAQYDNLRFRTYYRGESPTTTTINGGETQSWNVTTINSEILHYLSLKEHQSLLWGINYQYNWLGKNPSMPTDKEQHLFAIFIEDEMEFTAHFRATLGLRYDEHPIVPGHLSPRLSILYAIHPTHTFRLSFSQAYRNPTLEDSYVYSEANTGGFPNPSPYPVTYIRIGNTTLKPERVTAYELGYHGIIGNWLTLDVNLYYNRYSDFFSATRSMVYYAENELYPGSPANRFLKQIISSQRNSGTARAIGGEISATITPIESISGFINYSFQEITDLLDDPGTSTVNEANQVRNDIPKNKINAGLNVHLPLHLSFSTIAHWIDKKQRLFRLQGSGTTIYTVADYIILNARLGYQFWRKKAELALSVYNLFNHNYSEFPRIPNAPSADSEPISRQFTLSLNLHL